MSDLKLKKKEHILDIAAKEFADKGYDNSNINEIATLSGIGKGSIYLYFKTKKDLYLATMEKVVEKINESSEEIETNDGPLLEKLKMVIESLFKLEEESLPYIILWSRYQFQNHPDFPDEVFPIFEKLKQPLCDIIEEGVKKKIFYTSHPTESAYLILSMVVLLLPSIQPKPFLGELNSDEKIEYILNFIKNGLTYCKDQE
ncbi:hypothetical protein CWR48_19560 [Oceanobacillus arenosus]|uniref:HTH tetR-type domain-containing protein n=1 Tax=Oceanobacillus arenosus TaxID=1229153 RepID=A0A3D8PGL3_9BACI|nr:TetR/AcrR family transcriptional regulator [Oceanobacillus arenosus]RDW15226.1 hypothetical protein CWR48_19560 [Oceanobacillus arenosus]